MITVLYNIYSKHHICPDDFLRKSAMAQKLIINFTQYEIEKESKENKK